MKLSLVVVLAGVAYADPYGPADPKCTKVEVCRPGYTATVRPKNNEIKRLKRLLCEKAFPEDVPGCMARHELDHYRPLELCGAPRDPYNLSLEPWPEAHKKDPDETHLHHVMCAPGSTLTPDQAWAQLKKRWDFWTPAKAGSGPVGGLR